MDKPAVPAAMTTTSNAVAASRAQMLGKTGASLRGLERWAAASWEVIGRGALHLKHSLLAAGFCQLQRGHCMGSEAGVLKPV
ncbi:MAG TPA: hypothetical protein VN156_16620 [Pseudomonas sp.]|nr:hypothetical protein [Pseudomonas sp.]